VSAGASCENERKLTVWPSPLIEGTKFAPPVGDAFVPAEMLESARPVVQVAVIPRQVFRTKTFYTPLLVFPRFDASEENATNWPESLMLGCSLRPLAGVVPLGVDTNVVEGVHVVVVATPRHVSRT
jgi:hypothetical protein